jgi:hypothetical protein
MSAPSTRLGTPQGPGSVSGAPQLPAGVTDTVTSRYLDSGLAILPGSWPTERGASADAGDGRPGCSHRRRPG